MAHWHNIKGFENYAINKNGEVKNITTNKLLKPIDDGRGYMRVGLYKNKRRYLSSVHRLVAEAFIPNPDNLPFINHKNENPSDNHVDNLEWCTPKYNSNYGTNIARIVETKKKNNVYQKFAEKVSKPIICLETNIVYPSIKIASEMTGIDRTGLSRACTGVYSQCGGYHWSFIKGVS